MAEKNFDQLPAVELLVDEDTIPVWKGSAAKITLQNLAQSLPITAPDTDAIAATVIDTLALGGTTTERGLVREVFISPGTPGDDAIGDARNPYRVETSAQLDHLLRSLASNYRDADGKTLPLHLYFGPGNFLTKGEYHPTAVPPLPPTYPGIPVYPDVELAQGWLVHDDWIIEGAGAGITTITQDGWPTFEGGIWPYTHAVISGAPGNIGYASHRAQVRNLTVNCNANAITERPKGIKLDAVHLYGNDTRIDKVHVKEAYGKNFVSQAGVSTTVGNPGVVTAPAHGLGPNDIVAFSKAITAVAVSNPAQVTSAGHGRRNGEVLTITGVTNVTPVINGSHTITVIDVNTFSLNGVNVTATGAVGGAALWASAQVFITPIDANTFVIQEPAFSETYAAFTHAGSGLTIGWGGGLGECFALSINAVAAQSAGTGYPDGATDITGAVIRDCVVEDFATGSNYELVITITPGPTGNGIIVGNVVRRPPGIANVTNAFAAGGVGSMIMHNRAENCGSLGHFDSTRISGLLIAHNIAINCFYFGISIQPAFAGANYDNITISGNYFVIDTLVRTGWGMTAAWQGAAGTSLKNVIIRDNTFRHTGHTAVGAYAAGLVLTNIEGLTVVGNVIESTFDQSFTGNTNVVIRDNHDEVGDMPDDLHDTGNAITYLVADLPANAQQGDTAIVTNASAPTYLAPVVGGGAVVARVLFNGTTWVAS